MGVRSVKYQPLGPSFGIFMGLYIIFMNMGCIFGKYQQFWVYIFMNSRILGVLLDEICIYGPIFWHLYAICMGLKFCHYRYMG